MQLSSTVTTIMNSTNSYFILIVLVYLVVNVPSFSESAIVEAREAGGSPYAVNDASIPVSVPMYFSESVLSVELLEVTDIDAWEPGTPLSVEMKLKEQTKTRNTFSLKSEAHLEFEESNTLGIGVEVTSSAFTASPVDVTDALSILRILVPDDSSATVQFQVSATNDKQSNPSTVVADAAFSLSSIPTLTGLYPSVASTSSGADVYLTGSSLEGDVAGCLVGDTLITPLRLNSTRARCTVPPGLSPGAYRVSVLTAAGIASNYLRLVIIEDMHIVGVVPSAVSTRGGAVVDVVLAADALAAEVYCVFSAKTFVAGEWLSRRSVRCIAPAADSVGTDSLALACSTQRAASNSVNITRVAVPSVASISPSSVVLSRVVPQTVAVSGQGFLPSGYSCLLGGYYTAFHYTSALSGACVVPQTMDVVGVQELALVLNMMEIFWTGVSVALVQ